MYWKEQLSGLKDKISIVDDKRAKELDTEKETSIPAIESEPSYKTFDPIRPQPIISPKIYEAEFLVKGNDVIFHFWPHGYHEADDLNKILPRFPKMFQSILKESMSEVIANNSVSLAIEEDKDMGAWFIKANNLAINPMYKDLCIKVCEMIHKKMGGQ